MTLTLLTFYSPAWQGIADLTIPNRDAYCARHGYSHEIKVGPYSPDTSLYYAFDRLVYLRDLLFGAPGDPLRRAPVSPLPVPDLVWVLNLQSVITNLSKRLDGLLTGLGQGSQFWCTPDRNVAINMGSFVVMRTPWARQWLDHLISLEPQYRTDCWAENRAVLDTWERPEWKPHICRLDQRALNGYPYAQLWPHHDWGTSAGQWHPGDLVLSFPGTSYEQRLGLVRDALANKVIS